MRRLAIAAVLVAGCKGESPLFEPDPQPLFDKAVQSLRAKQPAEAMPPLKEALAMAQKMRPGEKRIHTMSRAGQLYWSLQERALAESTLLAAAKEIDASPAAATPATSAMTFRMLGIVYRDLGRPADAIPWLERAIAAGRGMPEAGMDKNVKYMNLASNIQDLANQQCRAGLGPAAEATDAQRASVCGNLNNPASVAACVSTPRNCSRGMMQGEKRLW